MIKVGDKFKDELKEWTVCEVYRGAALAFSGNITREFSKQYIYTIMYLEQKQRADELEKRWSELVDVLKKKYEYYKVRADDESAEPVEQGKWKIAKHELMMVLMTIAELQEDDND